jgi:hypothetical protein
MGARHFTKDEVKILITYIDFFYDQCIISGEKFKDKSKYEIIEEILGVIKVNEEKKPNLRIVK